VLLFPWMGFIATRENWTKWMTPSRLTKEEELLTLSTPKSPALLKFLQSLKAEGKGFAPSFDHNIGDPIENDIPILPEHKLVIVEGIYLLLEEEPWDQLSKLFDERWFIDCDLDVAMERVRVRHMGTGLSDEQARYRVESNDRPNGVIVQATKKRATRIVMNE